MPYCERAGPGLFDEPVNAITNAAFFVAAWAAWSLAHQLNALSTEIWVLIGLCASVGVGSMLWHTFASPWAHPLDVVPILLFQLSFIWVYGRRQAHVRWQVIILVLLVYVGAALVGRQHRMLLRLTRVTVVVRQRLPSSPSANRHRRNCLSRRVPGQGRKVHGSCCQPIW